ncbi:M4 family metallopeptidase [Chloroflexus sp.]|uniref:M4 family metallopeptidase n=1 Tax=Chloroflexus sp. TaxID=1904827 RepID=UPI00298F2954|nr:M4 family metallopeptidase [Chloroflexus sp.]MDW8403795.1 M4 family metallopeptidase [Chloroflexus sp.]
MRAVDDRVSKGMRVPAIAKRNRLGTLTCALLAAFLIAHPWLIAPVVAGIRPYHAPVAAQAGNAFTALAARATSPLIAAWDARTGIPTFLVPATVDGRLPYTPTPAEIGNPLAIARGFLDRERALFGLRSVAAELRPLPLEPDRQLGFHHVRFEQVYHGLPVFGRQLIVHLDPNGQVVAVNGHFEPRITVDTQPALAPQAAVTIALSHIWQELEPDERMRAQLTPLPDRTRLMIYVRDDGHATLVWRVRVLAHSPLGEWQVFVHARRGSVVHAIDQLAGAKRRRTYTANNTTRLPGRLLAEEGELPRDAIARAAHEGAGKVYDYYFNTHQRDSFDGRGGPMVSTVSYGSDPEDADNAAWVGELKQMIYGDGGKLFRPLPYGLDVIGHEFTHGVIDATAQLIYEGQSGALNESYADVFAVMIDRDDWLIGEDVVKSPPYPVNHLRSLADPTLGGRYNVRDPLRSVGQPATMSEYANLPNTRRTDNGGVHVNSGIPNHAAYLLAQQIGREKVERIYYRTLTQYLTPSSNFADAAAATARAAADLYGQTEVAAVREAFAAVGITSTATPGGPVVQPPSSLPSPPSAPPAAQNLPPGCSDVIVNGGFEADAGWEQVTTLDESLIDTELPRSGKRSAWLGGTDQESLQYIYQDVRIPANATSVELRYTRLVHFELSGLAGLFAGEAIFSVVIADTRTNPLTTVEQIRSSDGDDTWGDRRADLSQYAGKTVRVIFAAENPRGNISSMFVDDVALVVCTTGNAPSAPPVTNNDVVFLQGTVSDADSGRGVRGAQIFILRPGITARQAAADDTLTPDEVLTMAIADDNGGFRTEQPVPRGQSYSVIVVARGYRTILSDGELRVPATATNPYRVDAQMRRSR